MASYQMWYVLTAIGSLLLGFFLNVLFNILYNNYQNKKKRREEKLRIHFDDDIKKVVMHLTQMAKGFTIRNNRLVFGSLAPVSENYDFEQQNSYKCFEAHFPKMTQEWLRLNHEALELKELLAEILTKKSRIGTLEMVMDVGYQYVSDRELNSKPEEINFRNLLRNTIPLSQRR